MKKLLSIIQIIQSIRKELKNVSVTDVAAKMDCTTKNIYYHLGRGKDASLENIQKIIDAIDQVKDDNEKVKALQLKKLSKKIA